MAHAIPGLAAVPSARRHHRPRHLPAICSCSCLRHCGDREMHSTAQLQEQACNTLRSVNSASISVYQRLAGCTNGLNRQKIKIKAGGTAPFNYAPFRALPASQTASTPGRHFERTPNQGYICVPSSGPPIEASTIRQTSSMGSQRSLGQRLRYAVSAVTDHVTCRAFISAPCTVQRQFSLVFCLWRSWRLWVSGASAGSLIVLGGHVLCVASIV